jgi:putative DNA methylase
VTIKKKLIEVALPLDAINLESAREKSIRHGHPSTLHLWWARRPLAACRAIIFASYVDDPSAHPDRFPTEEAQRVERERLFKIIENLIEWDNSTNGGVISAAQQEIRESCADDCPPIYDPFCGGGSIPLEAQRLGLHSGASDLNPVATLITKALVEIPARFANCPPVHPSEGTLAGADSWTGAQGLAEDVRYYGNWMRDEAERRIGHLYPNVRLPAEQGGAEARVIAWIWARTVKSPNPAWDGPMPLVRSFVLSSRKGNETWVEPIIDRQQRRIHFEIRRGRGGPEGTVGRSGAVCLATGIPVPLAYVREQGRAGRMGVQLMAMVAEGSRGRVYLAPTDEHERVAQSIVAPDGVPDAELPRNPRDFKTPNYGMTRFSDLFTNRQLVALCTFSDLVAEARSRLLADGADEAYADAVVTYLAFTVDKMADRNSTICAWETRKERLRGTFQRQALPMSWDFVEANALGRAGGDFGVSLFSTWEVLDRLNGHVPASVTQLDATALQLDEPRVYVTDPPYYDNIGYADLSDFFYVWLRRSLKGIYPEIFSTLLVPKSQELVATPYRFGGNRQAADEHFESGLGLTFRAMRSTQAVGFPMTIIYAFKQTEEDEGAQHVASTGWETMLEALLAAGLSVQGTWPLRSELAHRMLASGTNALASSIALVCRPRSDLATLATRKDFLSSLKRELPEALRHLQQGNIAPVDLAQAAIGPGMAVFSRYSRVIEADGSSMTIRTALGLINAVLDETLAEQEADFDADTRWAVAWFEQNGMNSGPFGVAEILSKAKNTAINGLVMAGILESKAGKVRLLDKTELPEVWDPAGDRRLTVWEVTQHLIRGLDSGGENKAAELLRMVGGLGETARELAYRLYVVCERKKWAKEALAYNSLVVAWPEISRLAAGSMAAGHTQGELL